MKTKAAWKYTFFAAGITLAAIMTFSSSLRRAEPDCIASQGQTIVKWKDQYWQCRHWWSPYCIWPIRRKHRTYKITVSEGIPVRNEKGMPVPVASGKIRAWTIYDAAAWNELEKRPAEKKRYQDYERIADNEYVVVVETRYWLFHDVEANLRLCLQKP